MLRSIGGMTREPSASNARLQRRPGPVATFGGSDASN
jgi:hypothetical protein